MLSQTNYQSFCKNHPNSIAKYYACEQPETKYCKNCALNIALCGKKIQKQLNEQQTQRKIILSKIADDMKANHVDLQTNQLYLQQIISILQLQSQPIYKKLLNLQQSIAQLARMKHQIEKLYQNQIRNKIKLQIIKLNTTKLSMISLKKQLSYIQSNFSNLIQLDDTISFNEISQKWNEMIDDIKKDNINDDDFNIALKIIKESVYNIETSFRQINRFTIINKSNIDNKLQISDIRYNIDGQKHMISDDSQCLIHQLRLNLENNLNFKKNCHNMKFQLQKTQRINKKVGKNNNYGGKNKENCLEIPVSSRKFQQNKLIS